jgi:hypothetical protein
MGARVMSNSLHRIRRHTDSTTQPEGNSMTTTHDTIATTTYVDHPPTTEYRYEDGSVAYTAYLSVEIDGADSIEQANDYAMAVRDAICLNKGNAEEALRRLPFDFHMHGPHGC